MRLHNTIKYYIIAISTVPGFHSKFPVRELDSQHVGFMKRINEFENETLIWSASIELHEFEPYELFLDYVCSV
jgi:hypothetical protein